MNSRFALIAMLAAIVAIGAFVVCLGMREPEHRVPPPAAQTPRPAPKPITPPKPQAPPPPPAAPAEPPAATPTTPDESGPLLEGTVTDERGQPVAGAVITGKTPGGISELAKTEPNGHFTVETVPPHITTLTATHPGYLPGTTDASHAALEPLRVAIMMKRAATITGGVTRGNNPFAGATILVDGLDKSTVTDPQGLFVLAEISPGPVTLRVTLPEVTATSTAPWLSQDIEAKAGETVNVTFDLPVSDSVIEGAVSLEGQPVSQALVAVSIANTRGEFKTHMDTAADGTFRFDSLPDGPADLAVSVPVTGGGQRKKSAHADLNPHEAIRQDFDFPVAGTVQGQVVGLRPDEHATVLAMQGVPKQPAEMTFEGFADLHRSVVATSEISSDGSFLFDALDPGDYCLMVVVGDIGTTEFRSASRIVTVIGGADVAARIIMR